MLAPNHAIDASNANKRGPLAIAVGVATVGRPAILRATLTAIRDQSRQADAIVVCAPSETDVEGVAAAHPDVEIVLGARGLAHQRNAILARLKGCDAVVFFDDDFIPCADYLQQVETVLLAQPDVMAVTGSLIADGIRGPGLDLAAARKLIEAAPLETNLTAVSEFYAAYGCNMAIRLGPVRDNELRFDEMLPSYAWLEDVDFSRRLARLGRIVKADAVRGVHMGAKSGRQSGVRLGYSQIANPIYLLRKGTCSPGRAFRLMAQNIASNLLKSFRPEAYIDRFGRLRGNARALADLLLGRLCPTRILQL